MKPKRNRPPLAGDEGTGERVIAHAIISARTPPVHCDTAFATLLAKAACRAAVRRRWRLARVFLVAAARLRWRVPG